MLELHTSLENTYSNLINNTSPGTLYPGEILQLRKEVTKFTIFLGTSIDVFETFQLNDSVDKLQTLPLTLQEQCPLMNSIIEALLLTKEDGSVHDGKRKLSAIHALTLLLSLKSQKMKNGFKAMFTALCVSYGAGEQFITMLNNIGLTHSWAKFSLMMKNREESLQEHILQKAGTNRPIILLMDNINLYKGKRKHIRLMKHAGPKMWNFTGRCLLIPEIDNSVNVTNETHCLEQQIDPLTLSVHDLLIDSDLAKKERWLQFVDSYFLDLMNIYFNKIPISEKKLKEMSSNEIDKYLKSIGNNSDVDEKNKLVIKVPKCVTKTVHKEKTDIVTLPLSLEDNSTIAGSVKILDEFADTFTLPKANVTSFCPFNLLTNNFDVKAARTQFELSLLRKDHDTYTQVVENRMRSSEKTLDGLPSDPHVRSTTLNSQQQKYYEDDSNFHDSYETLYHRLSTCIYENDENGLQLLREETNQENSDFLSTTDHLLRTPLHVAAEGRNETMARFLLENGVNVNIQEGSGLTPIHLAIINKDATLVQLLLDAGAAIRGPLFTSIPSPIEMAYILEDDHLIAILDKAKGESSDDDELIRIISQNSRSKEAQTNKLQERSKNEELDELLPLSRNKEGFVTILVGDVGTCKTNNAVMTRSADYKWIGLCPGDLHNIGYFCEAIFKIHGLSGMHHLLFNVLKRKKLTRDAFKDKKFNDENLIHVREGIRDGCKSYGLAAVEAFVESPMFPTKNELDRCLAENKSHNSILLSRFKEWKADIGSRDKAFHHRETAFSFYGPLLEMYDKVIKVGDGFMREAVYQLIFPVYGQTGFRNYAIESFRHVVNILAKWPPLTRATLQQNCSVFTSLSTNGIALDEYVESEVVKPFKHYTTGHSTVDVCEKVMSNIDMFKHVRKTYKHKDAFDVHRSARHSVASPLLDQVKGAWFCARQEFFYGKYQ